MAEAVAHSAVHGRTWKRARAADPVIAALLLPPLRPPEHQPQSAGQFQGGWLAAQVRVPPSMTVERNITLPRPQRWKPGAWICAAYSAEPSPHQQSHALSADHPGGSVVGG
jgi:hypothetical protein